MKPRVDISGRKTSIVAGGLFLVTAAVCISVMRDSWARTADSKAIAVGAQLFEHKWVPDDPLATHGDGLGPVFNAESCAQCHFQGGTGGSGPIHRNVLAFDVQPTRGDPSPHAGVVHHFALDASFLETRQQVHEQFPVVPGGRRVENGCSYVIADFDPVTFTTINTPALFGGGLVDRISDGAISRNALSRQLKNIGAELNLNFEGTSTGRPRILPDGRIGKFGWKGQFATIEEFVGAACAVELGLSNPLRKQDLPRTHSADADAALDMDRKQFRALVLYVEQLRPPVRVVPEDPDLRDRAARGERLFGEVGCADCHTPSLGGVDGLYSDLMLHDLDDRESGRGYGESIEEVPRPRDLPRPEEWKTPPLWGVADSAPYFHDGTSPTLRDAIFRHRGQARHVRKRYDELPAEDQQALIAFLNTLRAPATNSAHSELAAN